MNPTCPNPQTLQTHYNPPQVNPFLNPSQITHFNPPICSPSRHRCNATCHSYIEGVFITITDEPIHFSMDNTITYIDRLTGNQNTFSGKYYNKFSGTCVRAHTHTQPEDLQLLGRGNCITVASSSLACFSSAHLIEIKQ